MKTMIFDVDIAGHHLEYLHHFYLGALAHSDDDFVFFVSSSFNERKKQYTWPQTSNITFLYSTEEQTAKCLDSKAWKAGLYYTWLLRKVINQVKPDKVLVTTATVFMPFARFILPRDCKVSGIMYTIYSYEKDAWPKWRLQAERWRIRSSVKSSVFDSIYLLNDEDSCKLWNEYYHTSKFKYLVDPVPTVDPGTCTDIRIKLGIPANDKIFLHFGGMAERKGTLNILKAIISTTGNNLSDKTFVFAGRIYSDIHEDFYHLLEKAREKANILVYDEFVAYEFIYNLCFTTDFILMPYKMSNLSSGLLGYASLFKKTVIGPEKGLIGQLIRKYDLGYCIDVYDIDSISHSFSLTPMKLNSVYRDVNTLDRFLSQLFD